MVKNRSNIKEVKYVKQWQEEEFESETKIITSMALMGNILSTMSAWKKSEIICTHQS